MAALDQKMVAFQDALEIADRIFDFYSMDARNDRFTDVHKYIVKELMTKYGKAHLKYVPEQ